MRTNLEMARMYQKRAKAYHEYAYFHANTGRRSLAVQYQQASSMDAKKARRHLFAAIEKGECK